MPAYDVKNYAVSFKDVNFSLKAYAIDNNSGDKISLRIPYIDHPGGDQKHADEKTDVQIVGFSDSAGDAFRWGPLALGNTRRTSADGAHSVSFVNSDRPGMITFSLLYESDSLLFIYSALAHAWNVDGDGSFEHVYWDCTTDNIRTHRKQTGYAGTMQTFDAFPSYGASAVGDLSFAITFPRVVIDDTPRRYVGASEGSQTRTPIFVPGREGTD